MRQQKNDPVEGRFHRVASPVSRRYRRIRRPRRRSSTSNSVLYRQFRRLLDLVYIGNWILNSTRGQERFADYDEVESLVFARAAIEGMPGLAELYQGEIVPSRAFVEGGIHEAIAEYENNVFFDILAEDLARRDMDDVPIDESNYAELTSRIDAYIAEFEEHGTDNVLVDIDT